MKEKENEALNALISNKESNYKIAKETGITEATIGNYRNGKTRPTKANSILLLNYFSNAENKIPVAKLSKDLFDGIPLIPFDAMAGICNGSASVMELDCERYVVPVFHGADFLIPVKGSSMYPKYSSGDIVACKKVPLNDLFFQWNKVYVLDTVQGPIIKRITKGSDQNHISAVSENPKYESFELRMDQLHAVAIVIGVIRLE